MKLYKYCGLNHLIENVVNNQLYFGEVQNLNDPYEGHHRFCVSNSLRPSYYKLFYGENYNEHLFNNIKPNELDNRIVEEHMNTIRTNFGICSFSEIDDSITMWGHYADKHKGICLEFDANSEVFAQAVKVKYSNNIYCIDINNSSDLSEEHLLKHGYDLLFHKSVDWSYEREWRIINRANTTIKYNPILLTGIYFGFYTPINVIRELFFKTSNRTGLKYYRPLMDRAEYRFVFVETTINDLKKD